MTDLVIDEKNIQRLEEIAKREKRPVNDVLQSMIDQYAKQANNTEAEAIQSMLDAFDKRAAETSPLEAFIGMFDDIDATDLSMKATGSIGKYFTEKHDGPD